MNNKIKLHILCEVVNNYNYWIVELLHF